MAFLVSRKNGEVSSPSPSLSLRSGPGPAVGTSALHLGAKEKKKSSNFPLEFYLGWTKIEFVSEQTRSASASPEVKREKFSVALQEIAT